jgi:3-dehydroquinate dehydratase-2
VARVLVVQGAGMDMRGRSQVEIFGPETLPEINAGVEAHARDLGIEVEIVQSNDELELVERLRSADPSAYDALIINPAGFTSTSGPLPETIRNLPFPAFEVHASNPAARGVTSTILPACRGGVCGFGYAGYRLALEAVAPRGVAPG